ncbi:MAG TPA: bifunctional glutamine-synthetase adenylyltransferase/deadenyltransferase, partial [Actinobacteria bacterium]|nr:bifunctional glutamine-synthetase adenylyltransferase/deadenyltransferase [Actinomycetota bacterium]
VLEAFAASPTIRLSADGAARQLAALGYRDASAARTAVAELTTGLSRRSRLMRQTLPLMLDWISESPDPDLGLEQLRLLVAATADHAQLVATLRDTPIAAERLCHILGSSRLLGKLLDRIPEMLPVLGDDQALAATVTRDMLVGRAVHAVSTRPNRARQLRALRRFVQGRLVRTAVRDLLGLADMPTVGRELADTADAAAQAALTIATDHTRSDSRYRTLPEIPFSVIAMGKWGAQELNYASDIDVLFVYDTPTGTDPDLTRSYANQIAAGFVAALADVTADGIAYRVDTDLRPEGRNGPLARSLDSYAAYYDRWAATWEYQSLIKARPAAGDPTLGAAFITLITPHVYPETLPPDTIRNIRTMKARIEHERLPHDAAFHLKLGPGGLTDIEFFTQLLQLRHGGREPALRTEGTIPALKELARAGILTAEQAYTMISAYRFCARVRNRLYLQLGKPADALPTDGVQGVRLGRSLGYEEAPRSALREEYRRLTRRARRLVETGFYHDSMR